MKEDDMKKARRRRKGKGRHTKSNMQFCLLSSSSRIKLLQINTNRH
jgi:hypothetical protein